VRIDHPFAWLESILRVPGEPLNRLIEKIVPYL
jgi:hypothetical protein